MRLKGSALLAGPSLAPLREDSREAPLWPPQPRNTGEEAIWAGQDVARNPTSGYHVGGKPCFGDQGPGVWAYSSDKRSRKGFILGIELSQLLSGTGRLCFLRTSFFLSTLDPQTP